MKSNTHIQYTHSFKSDFILSYNIYQIFGRIHHDLVVRARWSRSWLLLVALGNSALQCERTVNACAQTISVGPGWYTKCETLIRLLFMCINEQEAKAHKATYELRKRKALYRSTCVPCFSVCVCVWIFRFGVWNRSKKCIRLHCKRCGSYICNSSTQ